MRQPGFRAIRPEAPLREPRETVWIIEVPEQWQDSGRGEFDSFDDAHDYAERAIGRPWRIRRIDR